MSSGEFHNLPLPSYDELLEENRSLEDQISEMTTNYLYQTILKESREADLDAMKKEREAAACRDQEKIAKLTAEVQNANAWKYRIAQAANNWMKANEQCRRAIEHAEKCAKVFEEVFLEMDFEADASGSEGGESVAPWTATVTVNNPGSLSSPVRRASDQNSGLDPATEEDARPESHNVTTT
ncbi:MAG: hypothetical protein Q9219_002505 [cf. Caloplaca sp. 3 TL-2023]